MPAAKILTVHLISASAKLLMNKANVSLRLTVLPVRVTLLVLLKVVMKARALVQQPNLVVSVPPAILA